MMLLDTCVVFELARVRPDPNVLGWMQRHRGAALYLSVVTLAELHKGLARVVSTPRFDALSTWLDGIERDYADRVLPVDAPVARRWGHLVGRASAQGVAIPLLDGLIAATALEHGLVVVTRNEADFRHAEVRVVNPW